MLTLTHFSNCSTWCAQLTRLYSIITVLLLEHTNIESDTLIVSCICISVFSYQSDESDDNSEDERGDNNADKNSPCGKKITVQY